MGGNYSRVKTWAPSDSLTASDLNAEHDNHISNHTPQGLDDYSATNAQMDSTADPYPGSVQSLSTSGAGEIERLRYVIAEMHGGAKWYVSTAMLALSGGTMTGAIVLPAGSAAAPAVGWTDTGFYEGTANEIHHSLNGVNKWHEQANKFQGAANNAAAILNEASSSTNPTLCPDKAQLTTGMGSATGEVHLIVSGVSALGISATGLVGSTWPSFSVHKNGTLQASVGTALAIITWSTELFDTNSDFVTNRFTPTVAGKYLLTASLEFAVVAAGDTVVVAIYKNGVEVNKGQLVAPDANANTVPITAVVDANGSTDYFEIYGANITQTDSVEGGITKTFFSGSRIG